MSKDEKPLPVEGKTKDGVKPEPPNCGKRRFAVAALIVVALAALLLCTGAFFSGCTPSAAPGSSSAAAAGSTDGQGEATGQEHEHDWAVTYKTVHHDAVTHTETVEPVYGEETTYHTVCNECQQVIDGVADQHIRETGHSGYSTNVPITNEVLVSEGYTYEVTDTPAYDEAVPDELVCTLCGETRPIDGNTAS